MLNRFFEHQVLVINVDYIKQSFESEIIYVLYFFLVLS